MLPMEKELFDQQTKQDPVISHLMDSTDKYSITVKSRYQLSDEQLDVIIAIVEADVVKRIKPFDIAIDISLYTGFGDVHVIKTPKGIKIIID